MLDHKVQSLIGQLSDLTQVELLGAEKAFRLERRFVNFCPFKVQNSKLRGPHRIDWQLCDSELEAHRGYLRLDDDYVRVLTLKELPSETRPLLLNGLLDIPANFHVVTEWHPVDNARARKEINKRRRHYHNSKTSFLSNLQDRENSRPQDELVDDSKEAAISELGEALTALGMEGKSFGEFTLSVVIYDRERRKVDQAVAELEKLFTQHDALLYEERYNLLNAFFATIPGNKHFNLRKQWTLNSNYAHLSFLFTIDQGDLWNPHLEREYLAVLESIHGTPYYLNLHSGDVAHTLVLGATGSGKTTLVNVPASFIPDQERILVLEDTSELSIKKPHVISAEAQLDTHKTEIDFGDLLRASLRHHPDRIILGEIRGNEARVFLDALNTGHHGSFSTIHANGAEDALRRLSQLAMRGSGGVSLSDVENECRRSIDLVVHVVKTAGHRHVAEIARTTGLTAFVSHDEHS